MKRIIPFIMFSIILTSISAHGVTVYISNTWITADSKFAMSWSSESGKRYNIEYTDDLQNWHWWENIQSQGATTTWQKNLVDFPSGRSVRVKLIPTKFDLDTCFIKRLPEIDYVWGSTNPTVEGWPSVGQTVTWRAYVRHWGSYQINNIPYAWYLDDNMVQSGFATINPGVYNTFDFDWTWTFERHTIKFVIDHTNNVDENFELNNQLTVFSNAISVGFYVEQDLYDYFHTYQRDLGVGANSWDDWAQRQIKKWNEMCAEAVYGSDAPNGVLDRFRLDEIHIVPNGALPLAGGLPTNHPNYNDRTVDLQWGFPRTLLDGTMYSNHTSVSYSNPFYIEQSLLHELGHARYLIDCYGFDTHNTSSHHSVQIYEGSTYVAGSSYMPFIAWGEVLYYNKSGGVMTGPYGFNWSPYETMALNRIAGRRAVYGNYNAPGNIGVFLQDLPQNNHIKITDGNGLKRVGANVRIYEAESGPGWYGKTFDNTYDQEYTTDSNGYIHVGRNPFNPGGAITHTYGKADGVMILRISHNGQIWYRFMEVSDFNIEYWRGNTQDAYYTIQVN